MQQRTNVWWGLCSACPVFSTSLNRVSRFPNCLCSIFAVEPSSLGRRIRQKCFDLHTSYLVLSTAFEESTPRIRPSVLGRIGNFYTSCSKQKVDFDVPKNKKAKSKAFSKHDIKSCPFYFPNILCNCRDSQFFHPEGHVVATDKCSYIVH